ncbi:histidine phosphatase family protein [Pseudonocardia sp. TRM90224]|uniref:histidine phosphatase family protein n=1 Tax=Pseudonocardia sp. TRM90224 TaxID=2812678 RepID=UPI001E2C06D8|nr:histidine phosphatase family protein [Pseudonocardia sp. TRM90224]
MSVSRLVLARHGQTDSNVNRILDSRPPGAPLNAEGLDQAAALGKRLAHEPVTAVHASVATRAQQTAAPVAAAHELPVQVVEGVHEVFVGELEGRNDVEALQQFEKVYNAWWQGDLDAHLPGGESAHELRDRFVPAVQGIVNTEPGTVVLVSHGAAIRLAAAALLGDTAETLWLPNTGLVILRAEPTVECGWVLELWDTGDRPPVPGDVTGGAPD